MRHITPRPNTRLPHRVQSLLNDMYAGSTGLSGRQIVDFFGKHSLKVPVYATFRSNNRSAIFEHCLSLFPLVKQKELVSELIDSAHVGWYGAPSESDTAVIRGLAARRGATADKTLIRSETA
jgi:hypothetical protein